jgi:hypothetical protein
MFKTLMTRSSHRQESPVFALHIRQLLAFLSGLALILGLSAMEQWHHKQQPQTVQVLIDRHGWEKYEET